MRTQPRAEIGKTWRVALATRIGIGVLATFMFGIAALMFGLQIVYGRSEHGEDWVLILCGIVVAGFGVFETFALVAIARTRLTLDSTTLNGTVIDGHTWLLIPRFRSLRLSLSDIRTIERRSEIFRTLGFTTIRGAVSLVTTGGERIGLFSNTLGSVDTLPLEEVANAIAAAAGTTVTNDGTVLTKGSGLYGGASSSWTERPLDATTASRARRAAFVTVQICTALLLLTFVLRSCV